MQVLAPGAIRAAASTFPLGTGLGGDNIAPRAFLRLSDTACAALALLLAPFESAGNWSTALDLVMIALLPKSDDGFRPIGLFPIVIRLWMRARIGLARAWVSVNHLPSLYGGAGMGAQRAAWQAAFVSAIASFNKLDHVSGQRVRWCDQLNCTFHYELEVSGLFEFER